MDSYAHTHAQVLTDRPPNTHLASLNNHSSNTAKPSSTDTLKSVNTTSNPGGDHAGANISSMDYHRRVLQGKLANGEKTQGAYVSPSDDIMSPCTKKLSDLKGKRFKNAGKPQTLFAKLGKKNFEQSSAAGAGAGAGA